MDLALIVGNTFLGVVKELLVVTYGIMKKDYVN